MTLSVAHITQMERFAALYELIFDFGNRVIRIAQIAYCLTRLYCCPIQRETLSRQTPDNRTHFAHWLNCESVCPRFGACRFSIAAFPLRTSQEDDNRSHALPYQSYSVCDKESWFAKKRHMVGSDFSRNTVFIHSKKRTHHVCCATGDFPFRGGKSASSRISWIQAQS